MRPVFIKLDATGYYMLEGHEIYEAQSDRCAVGGKKHRLHKAGNLTDTTITRQRDNAKSRHAVCRKNSGEKGGRKKASLCKKVAENVKILPNSQTSEAPRKKVGLSDCFAFSLFFKRRET